METAVNAEVLPSNRYQNSVDFIKTSIGKDTFSNPCFWILIGIIGTLGAQYFLKNKYDR